MKNLCRFNRCFCTFCLVLFASSFTAVYATVNDTLKAYAAPQAAVLNNDFTVKVREKGKPWKNLATYQVKVDQVRGTGHHVENASMSYFDFSGEVELAVTSNKEPLKSLRIRPLSRNIGFKKVGNTATFKLNKPANLSVEINGDIFHNLHLFANPVETLIPDRNDSNVIYYGPGIHEIPGKKLLAPSGKTIYIAGGAIIQGQVLVENAENVRVTGRGMIEGGIRIIRSKKVEVNGLFTTACFTGGSENITIRNVKSMTSYGWGDGMNVISSNNVLFDGVFNRNSDDCTTVYGTRLGFEGGCKNITMQNSTLWADVAHPILVGTHGNTAHPEILEDLSYINIDILQQNEKQIDYQGCIALNAGDSNLIRNVRFENIRVEDFSHGQLLNFRVYFNQKYNTSPGRGIENVLIKNVSYKGSNPMTSIIAGYDEQRSIKNIVFEGFKINGILITDDMPGKPKWFKTSDMADMFVGEHVSGIIFRKSIQ